MLHMDDCQLWMGPHDLIQPTRLITLARPATSASPVDGLVQLKEAYMCHGCHFLVRPLSPIVCLSSREVLTLQVEGGVALGPCLLPVLQ
jgi:hypothetical protein